MPEYEAGTGGPAYVEPAIYEFEVVEAKEKVSGNSNDMIELCLEVGEGTKVYDHLVFARSSYWKIDAFRDCIGESIGSGKRSLDASDCVGKRGRVRLILEQFEGRTRNKVGEYLPPERRTKEATQIPKPPGGSASTKEPDDIPF